jgi:hypothetical protein
VGETAAEPVGEDGHPASTPAPESVPAAAGDTSLGAVFERAAKLVENVAAPLGALTGFLIFFGWTYSGAYFGHFGISQRLLQYSVRDQLLQSAQPMFGTAVVLLCVVGALWAADRASSGLRRRRGWVGRVARATTLAAGLVASAVGLWAALGRPFPSVLSPQAAALLLFAGALVLVRLRWAAGGKHPGRSFERALLVAAITIAVFWVTTLYATGAGTQLARDVDQVPVRLPLVTLFSERYLDLPGSSVVATEQRAPDGSPVYRYTGLRLLAYSNDRWFLLTGANEGYRSSVVVVRDDPALRFEVANQR